MDGAYLSTVAALSGSVIGGLTSLAASWLSHNAQTRSQQLAADKARRQKLYKCFIEEASRLYGEALATDHAEVANLVDLYAMVSRMRVICSPTIVAHAEAVVLLIIDTYFAPNKTLHDLKSDLRNDLNDGRMDPLRAFSEACRDDLTRV